MLESDAAFQAYRLAQARINNAASFLALERWMQQVGALRPGLPGSFTRDVTSTLIAARRLSRRLAQAWYQYARALDTGYQWGELEDAALDGTLDRLRQNFLDRLQESAQLGHEESGDISQEVQDFEQALRESGYDSDSNRNPRNQVLRRGQLDERIQEFLDSWGEDRELELEPFQWQEDSSSEDIRRWVREQLSEIAREDSRQRREAIRQRERADEEVSDDEVEEEHERAGQKIAGEVHSTVADAARKLTEWAHDRDRRIRWVARGTTATPCAFCAMLASRAAAPNVSNYRSVQSAMLTRNDAQNNDDYLWSNGFRKVHPNCNCYPIIKWIDGEGGEIPELNKEFYRIWQDTRDFNAFRRAIYRRNKQLMTRR